MLEPPDDLMDWEDMEQYNREEEARLKLLFEIHNKEIDNQTLGEK